MRESDICILVGGKASFLFKNTPLTFPQRHANAIYTWRPFTVLDRQMSRTTPDAPPYLIPSQYFAFNKLVFVVLVVLHVIMWPSVTTITFACAYGIISIARFRALLYEGVNTRKEFLTPGVFILESGSKKSMFLTLAVALYFTCYFIGFVAHEASQQPVSTRWIDSSLLGNYSFSDESGNARIPTDVTSAVSRSMRDNLFTWPRSIDFVPPLVIGSIDTIGPDRQPLACTANSSLPYQCYAKLWRQTATRPYIPISSDFYFVDVKITPAAGKNCADLEIYRTNLDPDQNVVHPLDYPGSSSTSGPGQASLITSSIFSDPAWPLGVTHAFSHTDYKAKIAEKCRAQGQALVLRLPVRNPDVDHDVGRIGLDVLVVTAGASVRMHATWKPDPPQSYSLLQPTWNQIVDSDSVQDWRMSTNATDIFIRFLFAVSPLLYCWYYLTIGFETYVSKSNIILLTTMVLFPSVLIFITIGAWVPMIGCLFCIIAVNQVSSTSHSVLTARLIEFVRHSLLFVLAATNSIQFAWLVALMAQAGYTAFYHDTTLHQLYDLSHSFIITSGAPPNWIAIILPCAMAINIAYLLGTAVCIALEVTAMRHRPI